MRFAVAIIGLMLWFVFLIQALLVNIFGSAGSNDSAEQGGAVGVLVAVVWLVGVALVFAIPRVSVGLFIAAGAIAWMGAASTIYSDLWVWGGLAFALAGLSYVSARQKRARDAKDRERDAMMEQMLKAQTTMAGVMTAPSSAAPTPPSTSET